MVWIEGEYDAPVEGVFLACRRALRHLRWDVEEYDEHEGYIRAKTGASLRSWGERVEISIWERDDSTTVRAESRPSGQLFDWGKDDENVERFFDELDNILGE